MSSVRDVAGVACDLTVRSSESIFDREVGFVGSGERWFRLSSPGRAGPREPRRAVLVAWRAGRAGKDVPKLHRGRVRDRGGGDRMPAWFGWPRRRYAVHAVQEYWLVNRDWWRESNPVPARPELEYWRVEASAGQGQPAGVYELRRDVAAEVWTLRRVED